MAIIKRNRTLRPSSREPQSTYKIDTSKVGIDDTLYVTITHEDNAEFKKVYIFDGKDLVDKNSIHFSYDEECIKWLGNLTYRKLDVSEINTREKKSAKREEKSKNEIKWIDDFTFGYPNRTWRNAGIAMLVIIILGFIIAVDNKGNTPNKFYQGPITLNQTKQDDSKELVVIDGVAKTYDALPRSEYDIINRWQETNMGEFSKECRIERLKKDGSYRICIGGIYYTCKPGTITNDSKIVFHDANVNNGNYFNLSKGTPVYYIPRMDDSWQEGIYVDGILVLEPNGSANIYMNDIDHRIFEIFTRLRPIY